MPQVPSSLAGLLSLLARMLHAANVSRRSACLWSGSVARVRDCTVTGMLQAAGLAGEWHHSRAHDFFARAALGSRSARAGAAGLPGVDVREDAARRSAWLLMTRCSGARAAWCGARTTCTTARNPRARDGARGGGTAGSWSCSSWSLNASAAGRSGCRSCSGCSAPRTSTHPDAPVTARARQDADRHDPRSASRRGSCELVMDGAYASKAWRGLPERVTVTTRMRANAAVYALASRASGSPASRAAPR